MCAIISRITWNVYVKFADEDDANKAKKALDGRYYMGRPIRCEFSPVTDFRESTCRQYEENTCTRGGYCNFMHLRPIKNATLAHALFGRYGKRQQDRRVYGNRGGGGGGGGGGRQRGGGGGYGRRGGGGGDQGREIDAAEEENTTTETRTIALEEKMMMAIERKPLVGLLG